MPVLEIEVKAFFKWNSNSLTRPYFSDPPTSPRWLCPGRNLSSLGEANREGRETPGAMPTELQSLNPPSGLAAQANWIVLS